MTTGAAAGHSWPPPGIRHQLTALPPGQLAKAEHIQAGAAGGGGVALGAVSHLSRAAHAFLTVPLRRLPALKR